MVVLAASVCTKSGKPLISRQFRPIPRSRIDGLLASFPKLIPIGSQHTTVETADVRFVYQPFEEVYVLLVTNKGSNILQDIATLSLIVRLISSLTPALNEPAILANSFELLCAFDEVVSLGYKESVSLQQVRNVLEGESHEEKIQEIIARNKEAEAKEELKRRAKQLEMQRREQQRRAAAEGRSNNSGGMGNSGGQYGGYGNGSGGGYQQAPAPRFEGVPADRDPYRSSSPAPSTLKPAFKGAGMKLGSKKTKQSDLLDALGGEAQVNEEDYAVAPVVTPTTPAAAATIAAASASAVSAVAAESVLPKVHQESIHISIKETLNLSLLRDGGLADALELKGVLNLAISDPSLSKIKLALKPSSDKITDLGRDLTFQQHPNVAKFAAGGQERIIALKNPDKGFPVGQGLGVLRWRLATKDESLVPLNITCWPTPRGDGTCDVNIEYELEAEHMTLQNVQISIPLAPGAYPQVGNHNGDWAVNPDTNSLIWTIDTIDASERTGTLEFSSDADDASRYFPLGVSFVSANSLCEVEVDTATLLETGDEEIFSQETVMGVETYSVV